MAPTSLCWSLASHESLSPPILEIGPLRLLILARCGPNGGVPERMSGAFLSGNQDPKPRSSAIKASSFAMSAWCVCK